MGQVRASTRPGAVPNSAFLCGSCGLTPSLGRMGVSGSIADGDRIGRLGVMYFRSLLAQAAVINGEISGGEDHLAVDLTVTFPVGSVTVQVKTGTKKVNKHGVIAVSTTKKWRDKWAVAKTPVYLVYVRLEKGQAADWIEHGDMHTLVHARAHWLRVDGLSDPTAKVPVANRLTSETFDEWVDDFEAAFGQAASA